MIKLSFRLQVIMAFITVVTVTVVTVIAVRTTAGDARYFGMRARQNSDWGIGKFYQNIAEKAMDMNTGAIIIDSLDNFLHFSGEAETGGTFMLEVRKDTIAPDSIILNIESRGTFGNVTDFQSRRIYLISPDSVNWFPEAR